MKFVWRVSRENTAAQCSHSVLCFSVLVKQNLKQGVQKLRPCRNCLKLKYSGQRIRV